ncbi:MAG: hypothetical protein WA810_16150 [Maribacter sp.]
MVRISILIVVFSTMCISVAQDKATGVVLVNEQQDGVSMTTYKKDTTRYKKARPLFIKSKFVIFKDRAMFHDKVLYDAQTDSELFMNSEMSSDVTCSPKYTSYYNPLSLVGHLYSYERYESSETQCIRRGGSYRVKTIAVETGEPISLLALFEERDIVEAFKKDVWIVGAAKNANSNLNEINDFKSVMHFAMDKLSADIQFSASGFCVSSYKDGVANIKFVGRGYVGNNNYRHVEMVFRLSVKKEAISFFEDKENFYEGRFENGLTK